jgi:hypothetical protein
MEKLLKSVLPVWNFYEGMYICNRFSNERVLLFRDSSMVDPDSSGCYPASRNRR